MKQVKQVRVKPAPDNGVELLHYAKVLEDIAGKPFKCGESTHIPGTVQVEYTPNASSETYFADNIAYIVSSQTGAPVLTIERAKVPSEIEAEWLGYIVKNNIVFEGQINPIEICVGYMITSTDGHERFVWVLKAKAAPSPDGASTKTGSIAFKNANYTMNCAMSAAVECFRIKVDTSALPEGVTREMLHEKWFTDPEWAISIADKEALPTEPTEPPEPPVG